MSSAIRLIPSEPCHHPRILSRTEDDKLVLRCDWHGMNPLADFIEHFPDTPWALGCEQHGVLDLSDPEDKSTQAHCAACREVVQP